MSKWVLYMVLGVVIFVFIMCILMFYFGMMSEVGYGYLVLGIPIIAILSGLFGLWMESSNKRIIVRNGWNGFLIGSGIGILLNAWRMTQGYYAEFGIYILLSAIIIAGGGGLIGGMLGGFLHGKIRKIFKLKPSLITASIGAFIAMQLFT